MIALTDAPPATDNATAPDDARRITELDADYCRIHAATLRRLTQSVHTLVRGLRRGDQQAVAAFLHRHTQLLREAYLAAHREGQRDYWQSVSLRYAKAPPFTPADEPTTRQRLAWYGVASIVKLAREAQAAYNVATHAKNARGGLSATTDAYTGILLAGGGDDALGEWEASVAPRLDLQAAIGWSGLQDGYLMGGRNDGANPFAFVWWILDPGVKLHCHDCPLMAMNSPFNQPGSGGNELDRVPGDGRTECGANCKCSLSYKPMGELMDIAAQNVWQTWLGAQNVAALQAGVGADVAAAGGDIALEPIAPDEYTPGSGPSGGVGEAVASSGGDVLPTDTISPFAGIPASAVIQIPNPPEEELTDKMKAALDAFRSAVDRWDAVRGDLPAAPAFFSATLDEIVGGELPDIALMEPEQRVAMYRVWDALAMWDAAVGGGEGEQQFAELGGHDPGYDAQPHVEHGHWGYGQGRQGGSSAGGGAGHGGRAAGAGEAPLREAMGANSGGGGGGGSGSSGAAHEPARSGNKTSGGHKPPEGYSQIFVRGEWQPARLNLEGKAVPIAGHEGVRFHNTAEGKQAMYDWMRQHAAGGEPAKVTYDEGARQNLDAKLGHALSDEHVAGLAGARPGDRVNVNKFGHVEVRSADGLYRSVTMLLAPDAEHPVSMVYNQLIENPRTGKPIAQDPLRLREQARAAQQVGVRGIHTQAQSKSTDYVDLPRLGYNARVDARLLTETKSGRLPMALRGAKSLLHLLSMPGGHEWWNAQAGSEGTYGHPGLIFNTHPYGLSVRTLNRVLISMREETVGGGK